MSGSRSVAFVITLGGLLYSGSVEAQASAAKRPERMASSVIALRPPIASAADRRIADFMMSKGLLPDSIVRRPNYAKEGAIIGGVALGVSTAVLGYLICQDLSDRGNCLAEAGGAGLLMGLVGAITGGLIGGAIDKHQVAGTARL